MMSMVTHKVTPISNQLLSELVSTRSPICLSLYQPTHRRTPENRQDPIRFRNLVKQLEASLPMDHPDVDARMLLAPFEALADDNDFWDQTLDGLAVFGGTHIFRVATLPQSVGELAVVADGFHTKPVQRLLQSVGRYQVLGLSLDKIRLFEGNRYVLDELDLAPGVPRTMADALGEELTEPHQTVASYGGVGGTSMLMHHGHGGKDDESDANRFFRAVDRAVHEHYSKPSGLPLILAALPEHHHLFHQLSQNPLLVADGIRGNPDALSIRELCTLAWQVIEPQYLAKLARLGEEFEQARAKGFGSDNPTDVARAAASGRVLTLLIEADRRIGGRLDDATGRVELASVDDGNAHDLLDELAELVVKRGGRMLVMPTEWMPSRTGLAGTYRY